MQLQPHHQRFDCRRRGLLVVLLVLCDTCSVAAILLVRVIASRVVGMYLLHISTAVVVTIELSNSGVCSFASPQNAGQ